MFYYEDTWSHELTFISASLMKRLHELDCLTLAMLCKFVYYLQIRLEACPRGSTRMVVLSGRFWNFLDITHGRKGLPDTIPHVFPVSSSVMKK